MHMNTKERRQQILRKIIDQQGIGDQGHLLNELRNKGIETTQATISRDLQEIGYVKIRVSSGVYRYELLDVWSDDLIRERLRVSFQNFVTEIRSANNLIIVKTTPGNANGVASSIDNLKHREILGTVAGDDTILIVVETGSSCKRLVREFQDI